MRIIETQIDIAASASCLWQILTDFPAYSDWNPFITERGATLTKRMLAFARRQAMLEDLGHCAIAVASAELALQVLGGQKVADCRRPTCHLVGEAPFLLAPCTGNYVSEILKYFLPH